MADATAVPAARMSDEEYQRTQESLVSLAALALLLPDLSRFLERIVEAHALGPFVDPTRYRRGMANLAKIETLARAAHAFQREARRQAGQPG